MSFRVMILAFKAFTGFWVLKTNTLITRIKKQTIFHASPKDKKKELWKILKFVSHDLILI